MELEVAECDILVLFQRCSGRDAEALDEMSDGFASIMRVSPSTPFSQIKIECIIHGRYRYEIDKSRRLLVTFGCAWHHSKGRDVSSTSDFQRESN